MIEKVSDKYGELFHYTTGSGLSGILSSQTIWATHAKYLNDSLEMRLFFERRLPELVKNSVTNELFGKNKNRYTQFLQQHEGKDAHEIVDVVGKRIVQAISSVTFKLHEPYFVSFCGAKDQHTQQNGLLSQWRGYGRDGGYAIAFSAKELEARIGEEAKIYSYQDLSLSDVHYMKPGLEEKNKEPEIVASEKTIFEIIPEFINGGEDGRKGELFHPVTQLSCLYKHWGFHEEREIRITAAPSHKDILAAERGAGIIKRSKPINFRNSEGMLIPYIKMFEQDQGPKINLPITKIIVGPHPDRQNRRKSIEMLVNSLELDVPVFESDIPYVGR